MSFKTFDLVSAIERVCWTDKVKTVIQCLECCGRNLYVGTKESFVICYILDEKSYPDGSTVFNAKKGAQKYLEYKRPIVLLKALSALNRILLLCDGHLVVLNMFDLEAVPSMSSKIKNVTYFCINENPEANNPFSVEVCIARKKQLQILHITDDKILHMKDVPTPEQPVVMSMDGQFVCAALSSKYIIVDIENGHIQDLFPFEDLFFPLVKRITKEEFLLSGPSALGVFVTTAGMAQRPPLSWGETVISIAYAHPYLVVLSTEFLTVYSIIDQQPKQRIAFCGGCYLDNFDGRIYVASADIICALQPVPWEKQVQALLHDKKVNEALELARYSNKAGLSKSQSDKIFQTIQQQAGFIELSQFRFDEAKELFLEGELDVKELISLFPNLMPSTSSFSRTSPPLHDIANIQEMCTLAPQMIPQCHDFLLHYLEEIRNTPISSGSKLEVDTALLKLYSERNSPSLISLINILDLGCNSKDGIECLIKYERYHALALFYCKLGENDRALIVWSRIITGEYTDPTFPGLPYLINFLCKLSDHSLVWKYADFVLERDEELGVRIFTSRENNVNSERMRPDHIVDYLHHFQIAMNQYLEYLVFEKKLQKEKFHTLLASRYLDNVLHILKLPEHEQGGLTEARSKLQHLLRFSTLYRVRLLLKKTIDCQLHIECAILYGRLEEHEEALRVLVHKLQDHNEAANYCLTMSEGKERKYRHCLFHTLLGVYLDPSIDEQKREEMLDPAVKLLNSGFAEFDATKVLQLIPSNWSVAVVQQFLNKALRSTLHNRFSSRVQSSLSRSINLQIKWTKIDIEKKPITITEERLCFICKRPFVEPSFVRCPNNVVTHLHCAKQYSGHPYKCKTLNIKR